NEATVGLTNLGSTNVGPEDCLCEDVEVEDDTEVVIRGNGRDSRNRVNIDLRSRIEVTQTARTQNINTVNINQNSGNVDVDDNTGDSTNEVTTGDNTATVTIENVGSLNQL